MRILTPLLGILFIALVTACDRSGFPPIKTDPYPVAKKVDSSNVYFGTRVEDPYRWLEDDNSLETLEWVKAENKVTDHYLEQIPFRDKIRSRLQELWDFPKYGVPFRKGEYIFFSKNDGMQNQSVIYIQKGEEGTPEVFLDPNTLSKDGTVALRGFSVNKSARYAAYSVAHSGSDWNEIFIMDIETRKRLPDHLKWVKFSSMAWHGNGFYYSRYAAPRDGKIFSAKNEYHMVYYHTVGTPQSQDKLIFKSEGYPQRTHYAQTTDDERFLIIYQAEGTSGSALYVRDLNKSSSRLKQVVSDYDYEYSVIDNVDNQLLILTTRGAPKWHLVKMNLRDPRPEKWQTIIPENKNVLKRAVLIGGKIAASYMEDVKSTVRLFNMDGSPAGVMELPGIGTVGSIRGSKDKEIAFYSFSSFTFPTTIYRYDVSGNSSTVYHQPELNFRTEDYETRQVFYTSKDGTKIPMFIVHKKGLKLDGNNPTLLYGYGGFNISITPRFSVVNLVLLENGFVYAVPNIRGGGEYGEAWHKAGIKMNKQNVFDDFIAAAEYLIKEKYTSPQKLAIYGRSNGGLLVGACLTQRPDLFKAAIPAVGVLDMLRYHKFTIGWAWASDYGRSDDSREMFAYLYGYSPLHNIKPGTHYPATLITTADHDDRVVPAHSFKFAATLQEAQGGDAPVLIRIETKAGHGAGKPTAKVIDEYTDMWSFIMYQLQVKP
ncbi:MAG TPA: S9 family peptidase [Caldithrix abyssi]|uniref:prolyl oligopeptidase n=1 Tax=Caldithrix abyssi TaxID=187145 RepID=A0A7V1LNJ9_CALAY|nr:S9 family peptidase [Caldithrix abyssi]